MGEAFHKLSCQNESSWILDDTRHSLDKQIQEQNHQLYTGWDSYWNDRINFWGVPDLPLVDHGHRSWHCSNSARRKFTSTPFCFKSWAAVCNAEWIMGDHDLWWLMLKNGWSMLISHILTISIPIFIILGQQWLLPAVAARCHGSDRTACGANKGEVDQVQEWFATM